MNATTQTDGGIVSADDLSDAEWSLLDLVSAVNNNGGCSHRFDLRFEAEAAPAITEGDFHDTLLRLRDMGLVESTGGEYFVTDLGEGVLDQ